MLFHKQVSPPNHFLTLSFSGLEVKSRHIRICLFDGENVSMIQKTSEKNFSSVILKLLCERCTKKRRSDDKLLCVVSDLEQHYHVENDIDGQGAKNMEFQHKGIVPCDVFSVCATNTGHMFSISLQSLSSIFLG